MPGNATQLPSGRLSVRPGQALVELLQGKPLKMTLCAQEQTLSDSISHAL